MAGCLAEPEPLYEESLRCGQGPSPQANETYRNPKKPGLYAVGSQTIYIRDFDRPFDQWNAIFGSEPYRDLIEDLDDIGEPRTLVTEVWYPVANNQTHGLSHATYLDYYGGDPEIFALRGLSPKLLTASGMTVEELQAADPAAHAALVESALDELASRERGSFVGAPVANGQFPLIVLSHGAYLSGQSPNANREVWTSEAERLASHGYVVVAMNHTGDSRHSVVFHDPGSVLVQQGDPQAVADAYDVMFSEPGIADKAFGALLFGGGAPVYNDLLKSLFQMRLDDAVTVIEHMEELDADPESPLHGHIDMDRIGMAGFSLGSITTQAALASVPEIDTGISWNNGLPKAWELPSFVDLTKPHMFSSGTEDQLTRDVFTNVPFGVYPAFGGSPNDLLMLPAERVFPPTAKNWDPVARSAYERAQGPKLMLDLVDSGHFDVIDFEDYLYPRHRLEAGELEVGFDDVLRRLPLGDEAAMMACDEEDVAELACGDEANLAACFVGECFEILGWEQRDDGTKWDYMPAQIRSYFSVAWFGLHLKGIQQYSHDLRHDPFGDRTRVDHEGI